MTDETNIPAAEAEITHQRRALRAPPSCLYDDEVNGEDTWFIRDQVLWELNYRNFGDEKPRPSDD